MLKFSLPNGNICKFHEVWEFIVYISICKKDIDFFKINFKYYCIITAILQSRKTHAVINK